MCQGCCRSEQVVNEFAVTKRLRQVCFLASGLLEFILTYPLACGKVVSILW